MGNSKLSKEEKEEIIKKTKYTPEDIEQLIKDFKVAAASDKKSGFSQEEFIKFFKVRFSNWDEASMVRMFTLFDSDGNGVIDVKEFITALYLMAKAPTLDLGIFFDLFDSDKSGYLEREEVDLVNIVVCCGKGLGYSINDAIDAVFITSCRHIADYQKGMSREEFIKSASQFENFVKVICFYESPCMPLY
ncbi:calcium-binding protein [Dictyostelium discoideum AX4]|uniref:NCS-1/frequenin-related protein n=1 Tax=Dictyostelium discoideum AX4 TaxID=352472 RepID=UPI000163DEBB|nr:calcium-binding protein [Dictyostelium discoideum AX4]EAL70072.2 calcium-binding protein [Dictyostelium discoideum AX4]|eukprot:XP_643889.2 calcium-binding protein [Dictyostelium discoideum AX4]